MNFLSTTTKHPPESPITKATTPAATLPPNQQQQQQQQLPSERGSDSSSEDGRLTRRGAHSYVYDEFTGDKAILRQHGFEPRQDGKIFVLCNWCLEAWEREQRVAARTPNTAKRKVVLKALNRRGEQCLNHLIKCKHCPEEALANLRDQAPPKHLDKFDSLLDSHRRRQQQQPAPDAGSAGDHTAGNNNNSRMSTTTTALDGLGPASKRLRKRAPPLFRGIDHERNQREQEVHNLQLLKEAREMIERLREKISCTTDPDVLEDLKEDLQFEVRRKRRLMEAL